MSKKIQQPPVRQPERQRINDGFVPSPPPTQPKDEKGYVPPPPPPPPPKKK